MSTATRKSAATNMNATKRLLREMSDYSKQPNECLLHLGPVSDDDLLHWEAVLKGVPGTPYEGAHSPSPSPRPSSSSFLMPFNVFA